MTKRDHFILLVQTAIIIGGPPTYTIDVLADAMKVAEVAIPDDLNLAAKEWLAWRVLGNVKPQWLAEHEENVSSVFLLEQLEGTREWWTNAELLIDGATVPASWKQFVTGRNRFVKMTKLEATAFEEWAREVRGWSDDEPPLRRLIDATNE